MKFAAIITYLSTYLLSYLDNNNDDDLRYFRTSPFEKHFLPLSLDWIMWNKIGSSQKFWNVVFVPKWATPGFFFYIFSTKHK